MARERTFVRKKTDLEYNLAKQIMDIVEPAVVANPEINLCLVRSFCEQMFEYNYPQDEKYQIVGNAVPTDTTDRY